MKLYNPRPKPTEEKPREPRSTTWLIVHTVMLALVSIVMYLFLGYLRSNTTFMAEHSDENYQKARVLALTVSFVFTVCLMYYCEIWRHKNNGGDDEN